MWDFSVTEPFEYVWEYAGVQYLIGTVSAKEIDPWKKIPASHARAPAARKNVLRSLHKLHQNDFLELRTIKIS